LWRWFKVGLAVFFAGIVVASLVALVTVPSVATTHSYELRGLCQSAGGPPNCSDGEIEFSTVWNARVTVSWAYQPILPVSDFDTRTSSCGSPSWANGSSDGFLVEGSFGVAAFTSPGGQIRCGFSSPGNGVSTTVENVSVVITLDSPYF